MSDAPWLESDEEFEGIGAHRNNPRYHPVDEPGYEPVDQPKRGEDDSTL